MKRSGPIKRYTELPRSKKKIPRINVERAKRERQKRDAFYRSPEWRAMRKQVLARAGGQCEGQVYFGDPEDIGSWERCTETRDLEVHHIRYTKVRKEATLGDLQVLCRPHHQWEESQRSYRAARRRAVGTQEAGA